MTRIRIHLSVYLLLICCALSLMAQNGASADSVVPGTVKFTGILNDPNGKPLTGTVGVTFLLYKEQSGGAPLWMETQNVHADANGRYSVMLGSTTNQGIPANNFSAGQARWIGAQPNGQAEQPRVELVSVPYALKAADAQTLGGLPASAFVLAAPSGSTANIAVAGTVASSSQTVGTTPVTTAGGTAKALAKFDANADIASSQIFDTGTSVGIGISAPLAKLDVNGITVIRGTLEPITKGIATANRGFNSNPLDLEASAFSSSTQKAVMQHFEWQAEPTGNNSSSPGATLNLLFGQDTNPLAETGLKISNSGIFTFAPGQTFPGGGGTVTSVGLGAPASDFSVSGSPVTSSGTLNLQWLVAPDTANTPNAIVKRDANGSFSAGLINVTQVNALSLQGELINASAQIASPSILAANVSSGNLFASPILGENDVTGAVQAFGVAGVSHASSGFDTFAAGVVGRTEAGGVGVLGTTNSDSGQGVWGETNATQISGNGFGPDGVDGISHSTLGAGVGAVNTTSGDGLFAQSNGGFAAFFLGDVDVDGKLSKAAGSFKIDHPLDPANKYLYHSFVESPDMMNIYNGTVTTDAQGNANVSLPDWFEALNRDFRYQLTVIGQFAQAIVASEVANHSFTIRTDKPNVKVSWQVTGIRQDAYANAHRIPVEEAKPEKERGLYLHPELFGAPVEKSIAASRHPGAMKLVTRGSAKLTGSTMHQAIKQQ